MLLLPAYLFHPELSAIQLMIKSLVATCMTLSAENRICVLEGLCVRGSCFGNAYPQAQIA